MYENSGTRIKKIQVKLRREFFVIAIVWLGLFSLAFYYYSYEIRKILDNEQLSRTGSIAESFANSLKGPIVTENVSAIEELSVRLVDQFEGSTVSVYKSTGESLLSASSASNEVTVAYTNDTLVDIPIVSETKALGNGVVTITPVEINNFTIGYIRFQLLSSEYSRIYLQILKRLFLLLSLLMVVGFSIYVFFANRLTKNIIGSLSKFRDEGRRDPLTNLPNRAAIYDYLSDIIAKYEFDGEWFSVCFIDLNKLKVVNDTLGHIAGDTLIRETADRLNSSLRSDDFLGRLAGDEFIIVLNGVGERKDLEPIISRIYLAVEKEFIFEGSMLHPSVSIGVSVYPHHGKTGVELIKAADQAMYSLKRLDEGKVKKFKIYTNSG